MTSLQNLCKILIFFNFFILIKSHIDDNLKKTCERYGGDIKLDRYGLGCSCRRMQNALRFEKKTTILPRFKKFVQFETIERNQDIKKSYSLVQTKYNLINL